MAAETPREVIEQFSRAMAEQDLGSAMELYEPNAVFSPEPGRPVSGLASIGEALEVFLALRPTLTGEIEKVLESDDIALVRNRWQLTGTGPEGEAVEMSGRSADVMRRQSDGSWRIAIDDPWSGGGG
jgi:uncharacterized protein (TIGR02246 family)